MFRRTEGSEGVHGNSADRRRGFFRKRNEKKDPEHGEDRPQRRGRKLRKLQTKLFSYMLLPPILVLCFFSLFFLQYNSKILIKNEQSLLETLNSTLMSTTEKQLNELDKFSSNLNFYNRKTDFLPDTLDFNVNSDQGRSFLDYVQTMNGLDPKANQINLYDFYGNVIESGMITKNTTYQSEDVPWMEQVKVLRGKKLLGTPYLTGRYTQGSVSTNWYLSLYRATLNKHNQVIGAIETAKSCKVIFRSISSYESKSSSQARIFIFSSDGTLIYPYENVTDQQRETYQNYYRTQAASDSSYGIGTDPETGIKYQYSRQTSSYSGWTYMALQQNSVILQPVYHMSRILFSVAGIMVLFSILFSLYLSHNMVKPIKHLKHVVQRMRLENLGEEKLDQYYASYDELDELYREFQNMSESLQQSLTELEISQKLELKSRVIALQVQMNPHFYYNTLSCISILAENGQNEDVTKLCQMLSQIMRYITNTGTTIVSVSDEIHYIQEYMYCMKVRYQESLDYSIDILPEIMEEQIPKLILQPLVENSIKYGTNCLPPWNITVSSYRDDRMWYIRVTDTGNGFEEEVLDELNTKIAEVNRDPRHKLTDLKIGGLGMINVYIRWKLYCGDDILFDFGNTEEGHAYVMIGRKTPDASSEEDVNKQDGNTAETKNKTRSAEKLQDFEARNNS